jgi:hypothetical protein
MGGSGLCMWDSLSLSFSLVMPISGEGDLAFVVHVLHTKCIKTSVVHETSIFVLYSGVSQQCSVLSRIPVCLVLSDVSGAVTVA